MQTVHTHTLDGGHTLVLTTDQKYHYFPKHYHETYSVAMLTDGAKNFRTNSDGGILDGTNIATMNPYEVHSGESIADDGWKQLVVLFDIQSCGRFAEENELKKKSLEFSGSVRDDSLFRLMVYRICSCVTTADSEMEKENLFELLMGSIFSAEKLLNINQPYMNKRGIGRSISMMMDEPAKKHSLEELAKTAGMSKFHYLRSFREATGLTPHAYLNITRVEKARRLIFTTDKSIADAAAECGFSDQAHLTRAYKKIYGAPPGSIRIK